MIYDIFRHEKTLKGTNVILTGRTHGIERACTLARDNAKEFQQRTIVREQDSATVLFDFTPKPKEIKH